MYIYVDCTDFQLTIYLNTFYTLSVTQYSYVCIYVYRAYF